MGTDRRSAIEYKAAPVSPYGLPAKQRLRQAVAVERPHRIGDALEDLVDRALLTGFHVRGHRREDLRALVEHALIGAVTAPAADPDRGALRAAARPSGNPAAQKPLLQQARGFVRNDFPGAVELFDLLFLPRAFAFLADGRIHADDRTGRGQLAADDRRDRVPDPLGLGRTAGQVDVDPGGLDLPRLTYPFLTTLTTGSSMAGKSSILCCPSLSKVTMYSAPCFKEYSMPVLRDAPCPLLIMCFRQVTPCLRASS